MARLGLFGNRTPDSTGRDPDGVDDRARTADRDGAAALDRDHDHDGIAGRGTAAARDRDRDGVPDAAETPTRPLPARPDTTDTTGTYHPVVDRPVTDRTPDDRTPEHRTVDDRTVERAAVDDRTLEHRAVDHRVPDDRTDRDGDGVPDRVETPVRVRSARVSMLATIGFALGLLGVAASLTGLLAPAGFLLGVLGAVCAFAGISAGARPHVAGRGLGAVGMLLSIAAVAVAVVAMTHDASWIDSNANEVQKLHDWLDARLPWFADL